MANENRLIYANKALRMIENSRNDNPFFNGKTTPVWEKAHDCALSCVIACPTVDAVEVVHGHKIGDVCFYGFHDGNKSLALVEIVKVLNNERGVAEVKFLKVFVDDTGNGLFNYLLKTNQTMNASFKYLKNITPTGAKMDGGNDNG